MSRTSAASPGTGLTPAVAGQRAHRLVLPQATTTVIIVATLAALALRLYQLSRPGYLLGITENDDGTDFGSAVRLIHGALPYRDFIMVQPPGITLLMAPVALATKTAGTVAGMAAGRVLTALASAAAVPLAGLLTRHRGLLAVTVTCGILAVYPDSLQAARTVLLEPWLVLACLLGALAVFDGDRLAGGRRLIWGGIAFGFAGAIKVWAILPVLVILALTARRPRQAARFAAGVAAGFLVPVLPFALAAPRTFYRSVVVAQLVRSDLTRVPLGLRLQHMLGLTHAAQLPTPALVAAGAAVVVIIAGLMVLGARLTHQPPPALDLFAAVTSGLVVAAFLLPADFYNHYAAFLAPFLALAIALPVSRVLGALPATGPWARAAAPLRRGAAAAAVVALTILAVLQAGAESSIAAAIPASEISAAERAIPPGACVVTDQVSYTIAINRFVSDMPGCSLMVDAVGSDYALSGGHNALTGAAAFPAVDRLWMSAFRSAQYLWITASSAPRIPWTPRLRAYLLANFVPLTEGPDWLYARKAARTP
ncbi:MAG TPA: glycosyltransferase 87 family protein [Streptosporangiaceae bacterium]|nr:glycosyltransferase 87 family protein [Streptosporangiaceae bacterium]